MPHVLFDTPAAPSQLDRARPWPWPVGVAALAESAVVPRPRAARRAVRRRRQGAAAGRTAGEVRRAAERDAKVIVGSTAGAGRGRDEAAAGRDGPLLPDVAGGETEAPRRA